MRKSSEKISDKNTIIYDGECKVCRFFVDVVRKHERDGGLDYLPSDDDSYISPDILKKTIVYIDEDRRVFTRAGALAAIFGRMTWRWKILGFIISLPILKQFADLAYRLLARHRHNISKVVD